MTAGIEVIMNVAHSVASLVGTVGFVRTGSIAGISILALAELWLCPWRGRWRFLGVICKHNHIARCFDFQIRCENSWEL